MEQIYLKIISDIQCLVYVDSEFVKTAEKGVVSKIPLRRGEYFVQLVSPINNDVAIEQVISLEYDRVLKVDFEQYLEKHIELIRDQDVEFCVIRNSYYNLILGKEITDAVYDSGASFVDGLARVERTGRYGCIDKFGREIISCVYDDVFLRDKNIYARLNGLWGLYDSHGNEMKPCQYLDKNLQFKVLIPFLSETISSYTGRSVVIIKDGKYGIVDLNGASIVPCIYDNMIYSNYSNCIKIELDGRCGLIDQDGKMLIPCIYEDLVSFNSGWAAVQKDKLWGCIDYQGAEILPFEYGSIENGRIKDHFDRVDGFNKKWGIIGSNGKLIADCIYDYSAYEESYDKITEFIDYYSFIDYYASHYGDWSRCDCEDHPDKFVEGMYPVARDGEYGFIDETGNEVIPCMYGAVFNFNNGLARVISDDKWLFIDKCANVILEHKCEYVSDFYEDLARIESGLWGYIDKTGTIVIPCKYDRCSVFNNGIAAVRTSYNSQVDDSENELIEDKASNKKDFWSLSYGEQMEILDSILNIKYQKRYKWRFIDGKGNNVTQDIDIDYDSVTPLNNILWLVRCSRGNLGIVDSTWKEILPCVYDEISSLQDGLVEVRLNDKYGLFDKCGSEVLPIIYDYISVDDGLVEVRLNDKYGLFDKCGSEVLPIIYDRVYRVQDGLIKVKLNNKYGLVDKCGNEALPIVYDSILQYSNSLIMIDLGGKFTICKYCV